MLKKLRPKREKIKRIKFEKNLNLNKSLILIKNSKNIEKF